MSSKKSPNLLQKLVRSVIRDLAAQVNGQQAAKQSKPKAKKSAATSSRPKLKQEVNKNSRHIPAKVRVSVLHRDKYRCVFCGRSAKEVKLEVDHIVAFSRGGSNDPSNLQTLCFDCNRGKGANPLV